MLTDSLLRITEHGGVLGLEYGAEADLLFVSDNLFCFFAFDEELDSSAIAT